MQPRRRFDRDFLRMIAGLPRISSSALFRSCHSGSLAGFQWMVKSLQRDQPLIAPLRGRELRGAFVLVPKQTINRVFSNL
jgi:hypothetical protein